MDLVELEVRRAREAEKVIPKSKTMQQKKQSKALTWRAKPANLLNFGFFPSVPRPYPELTFLGNLSWDGAKAVAVREERGGNGEEWGSNWEENWAGAREDGPWARVQSCSTGFSSKYSNHSPPLPQILSHTLSCSTQDLELLLSHRDEIEKIQNFVAQLQSAGLEGRVLWCCSNMKIFQRKTNKTL